MLQASIFQVNCILVALILNCTFSYFGCCPVFTPLKIWPPFTRCHHAELNWLGKQLQFLDQCNNCKLNKASCEFASLPYIYICYQEDPGPMYDTSENFCILIARCSVVEQEVCTFQTSIQVSSFSLWPVCLKWCWTWHCRIHLYYTCIFILNVRKFSWGTILKTICRILKESNSAGYMWVPNFMRGRKALAWPKRTYLFVDGVLQTLARQALDCVCNTIELHYENSPLEQMWWLHWMYEKQAVSDNYGNTISWLGLGNLIFICRTWLENCTLQSWFLALLLQCRTLFTW